MELNKNKSIEEMPLYWAGFIAANDWIPEYREGLSYVLATKVMNGGRVYIRKIEPFLDLMEFQLFANEFSRLPINFLED